MIFGILLNSPFFRSLSEDEISGILSETPRHIKRFKAGAIIAQSGEQVKSLMIVVEGIVKGEMVDYSGRVIKIEDIPAPGALASAFLFGKRNFYPVNVIAVSDTEILVIEKEDFLRLLLKDKRLTYKFP